MINLSPQMLLGRYIVFRPTLLSVFEIAGLPRYRRLVPRDWPWLVEGITDDTLKIGNTTTQHACTLKMSEILRWDGDAEGIANYFRPLEIHLGKQMFWNATNVWSGPIDAAVRSNWSKRSQIYRRI